MIAARAVPANRKRKASIKRVVLKEGVAAPLGPYSHAVAAGGFVFVSGQGPKDPATGAYIQSGVQEQTRQVILNLQTILKSVGLDLPDVVKSNVYLRDMKDFQAFNKAYAEFFKDAPPARTTVQAYPPVQDILVEIEVIAKTRD